MQKLVILLVISFSSTCFCPPDDGRKDARNMLRNNLLPIKSLTVASSWSYLYLLIKDAQSFEHKVYVYVGKKFWNTQTMAQLLTTDAIGYF
jgi:hypothetical protein